MPTYSYRCTACDNAFDIQQSFTDDSLTVCDQCGGALRKVFSAVGIAFKGSGFYATDHGAASKSASSATASEGASSSAGDSSSSSTTATPAAPASSGAAASSPTAS